jgi:hypothetical protein
MEYNENDDWDYSVPVLPPGAEEEESMELEDLQFLEDEFYAYHHHHPMNGSNAHLDNSILEDEVEMSPPRVVYQRQEETAICTTCLTQREKKRPPESLFYQTYPEMQMPPTSSSSNGIRSISPLLDDNDNDVLHNTSIAETEMTPPPNTTTDEIIMMTTSPTITNLKTPRIRNTNTKRRYVYPTNKKKTTHLHLSTIPPPPSACPLDFLLLLSSHDDDDDDAPSKKSPTSIVDIFADLESLQDQLHNNHNNNESPPSVATTSIASTTLGSLDTPTHCYYNDNDTDHACYYDDNEYIHPSSSNAEEEEKQEAAHWNVSRVIMEEGDAAAALQEEFQYLGVVQDESAAKEEECKERDWCTETHEGNIGDEHDAMQHVMDDDTRTHHHNNHNNNKKKKNALVIENNGTKVYQWNEACSSPNRNSAPIVISNDNKAVFHYDVVVMHPDKYSCLNACAPTITAAAEQASGYV